MNQARHPAVLRLDDSDEDRPPGEVRFEFDSIGLLDVKDQAVKHRVFGPVQTHGFPSGLFDRFLLSLSRQACFG